MRTVLDTNVLVSLLVFRDPRYARIWSAWAGGSLIVMSDDGVAEELRRVLAYPEFAARRDPAEAYAAYRERVTMLTGPHTVGNLPRCRDTDDQKFLELAEATNAQALVTEDKALLRLRRRCPFVIERPGAFMLRLPAVDALPL